jgi:putative heme-binding domain-containing protein
MTKRRLQNAGLGLLVFALLTGWPQAWQRPQSSLERAQDQPFPAGSPFALLPGFRIERVTPADKTESLIVVTFDSLGRPVVSQSSSGNGSSPRVLLDANGDGIFEGEKIVSDKLNTCHGLFYAGRTLYANCRGVVAGDPPPDAGLAQAQVAGQPPGGGRGNQGPTIGIPGFYKLEDTNGDHVMDTIERIQRYTSNGMGDHGPHAIRRGPDGSIMFLIGNNTYLGAAPVNDDAVDKDASPSWNNSKERQFLPQFNDPRFGNSTRIGVHATVWRLQPNNTFALFYSGMRNPYDFAYNLAGEAFVFDSDMEWDVNAPWYREVRTAHMIPGGDGGYRNGTGKLQDEYFDVLPALRHLRRGSPVGVEVYQSYAYPSSFFDNLFEADWSRGRLLYTALTPHGATFVGREDLAEFVHGEPMPITDLEVGPDGNIYLTTGGAAGQGGLYKVSWTGAKPPQPDMSGVLAIVRQPQPVSSWGWAAIERLKAAMSTPGARFGTELEKLARTATAASSDRARAILELQRHGPAPSPDLLRALIKDRDADVRAAAVYVAGAQTNDAAKAVAAAALEDASPLVKRRAAEAIVRQGLTAGKPSFAPVADIYSLLKDADRFVRYSGRIALEHTPRSEWMPLVLKETGLVPLTEGLLALTNTTPPQSDADLAPVFEKVVGLMKRPNLTPEEKIRVLRTFEVAATETRSGVAPEIRKPVHDALIAQMPSVAPTGNWIECTNQTGRATCSELLLAHHLAKVLAYTGEPDVIDKILALIPKGNDDQPGQIDYMYSLRVIDQGWTKAQKQQMIDWFAKSSMWRGGSTFAGHVNNIFDATIDALDAQEKQAAYAAAPLFAPLSVDEMAAAGGRGNAPPGAPAAGAGAPGAPGGGRGARGGPPATARNVPLDRQERYDNLVFPRGGGPGSLAGRGGAPNPVAGAQVFREVCAECHRFGTIGKEYAPELTRANTMLRRDILRSIFFPSEKVDELYETTVLVLRDSRTLRGLMTSENAQNVVLKIAGTADPVTVPKAQIAKRTKEKVSIMPDDLADKVGDAAVRDVTAYLLEGPGK